MAKAVSGRISLPAQEDLLKLLRYEAETGKLYWLTRPIEMFYDGGHGAAHNCAKWNAKLAGKEAFTAQKGDGYKHGAIHGRNFSAHRIIWKMMTGSDPDYIDHIDGNRTNNAWSNLRNVDFTTNRKNSARHADNTSGVSGVRWNKRSEKWQAYLQLSTGFIHLGVFKDFDDAVAARKAAERDNNFHPNHGREAVKRKES